MRRGGLGDAAVETQFEALSAKCDAGATVVVVVNAGVATGCGDGRGLAQHVAVPCDDGDARRKLDLDRHAPPRGGRGRET